MSDDELGHPVVDRGPMRFINTTQADVDEAFQRLPSGIPKLRLRHLGIALWAVAAIIVLYSIYHSPKQMTSYQMKHSLPAQPKI